MSSYKQINVLDRQSIDDIAIQEYGCVEGKWNLLADNSDRLQSVNDVPAPGMVLNIESPVPYITSQNQAIAATFAAKKLKVVSGASLPTPSIPLPQQNYINEIGYVDGGYIIPPQKIIALGNSSNTIAPPPLSGH